MNYLLNKELKKFTKIIKNSFANKNSNEIILVDLSVSHVGYLYGNLITALYLQVIKNYSITALVRHPLDRRAIHLANSFGINNFEYIGLKYLKLLNPVKYLNFLNHKLPIDKKDLLNLHIDKIKIGDLLYDSILRKTGEGTINNIEEVKNIILDSLFYFEIVKKIFINNKIKYFVSGHKVYVEFGVLARLCVYYKGETILKNPASGAFTIRKYSSLEDILNYEFKFSRNEFESYKNVHGIESRNKGLDYIESRLNGNNVEKDINAMVAYGSSKKKFSKDEVVEYCCFDKEKDIVSIMSHVLPDAPHSNSWLIYNDYYEWLKAVLEVAKINDSVNWLIKKHPANKFYLRNVKLEDDLIAKYTIYKHISLAPVNINTASLRDIIKAVVTCNGSAGLEFSALGIPCILGGESPYSDHGFTFEPKNSNELESILKNIKDIKSLADKQINDALSYLYLMYKDSRCESDFLPEVTADFWTEIDESQFWKEAKKRFLKYTFKEDPFYIALEKMILLDHDHILT